MNMNVFGEVRPEDALKTLAMFHFKTEFKIETTAIDDFVNEMWKEQGENGNQYRVCEADEEMKARFAADDELKDAFAISIMEAYVDQNFVPSETTRATTTELKDESDCDLLGMLKKIFDLKPLEIITIAKNSEELPADEVKRLIEEKKADIKKHHMTVDEVKELIKKWSKENKVKIAPTEYALMFEKIGVIKKRCCGDVDSANYRNWHWVGLCPSTKADD